MAKVLSPYKTDIIASVIPHKIKFKHTSSDFIERLTFDVHLPDTFTKIQFELAYLIKNQSVILNYAFIKALKKKTPKRVDYSLNNLTKDSILIGISPSVLTKLLDIQKFKVEEGTITAISSVEDQMAVYVSIIKDNLETLMESASQFSDIN